MVRSVDDRWRGSPSRPEDLREGFLAHCEAWNLSGRTVEWYEDRTRGFVDWCATQGIKSPRDLRSFDLEQLVLECGRQGFAPNKMAGVRPVRLARVDLGRHAGRSRRRHPRSRRGRVSVG